MSISVLFGIELDPQVMLRQVANDVEKYDENTTYRVLVLLPGTS